MSQSQDSTTAGNVQGDQVHLEVLLEWREEAHRLAEEQAVKRIAALMHEKANIEQRNINLQAENERLRREAAVPYLSQPHSQNEELERLKSEIQNLKDAATALERQVQEEVRLKSHEEVKNMQLRESLQLAYDHQSALQADVTELESQLAEAQQKIQELEEKYKQFRVKADKIMSERNKFSHKAELLGREVSPGQLAHVEAFMDLEDYQFRDYYTWSETCAARATADLTNASRASANSPARASRAPTSARQEAVKPSEVITASALPAQGQTASDLVLPPPTSALRTA